MPKDRWNELCQFVAHDDGLPVRNSGSWTAEKLYLWHQYIDMATTSMVGKSTWPAGIYYVDLLASGLINTPQNNRERLERTAIR